MEGARKLLKLKRVEIQGFKSFFDRTEMRFNGTGIAAVVGPNGCGKSNLSDAISWVLVSNRPSPCAAAGWKMSSSPVPANGNRWGWLRSR